MNEQAIMILAGLIDRTMPDAAVDTILNAIHYLRCGRYPDRKLRGRGASVNPVEV